MSVDDEIGRLSPERRFSLYSRVAELLHDLGAEEASRSARQMAAEVVKESPKLQAEMQFYLDAMKEES